MKMRVAKKILGIRKEHRAMFGLKGTTGAGWRLAAYRRATVLEAQRLIMRMERRHTFPSKWS